MAKIIDGKSIADEIRANLAIEVEKLKKLNIRFCLAVVVVGFNAASEIYVRNKIRFCESLKIDVKKIDLEESVSRSEFVSTVESLNLNGEVSGVLVQLPLPAHLQSVDLAGLIHPMKDVDGFCYENIGRLFVQKIGLFPCTACAIMHIFSHENVELEGKNCVVIGKSNIVGKPLALMLLNKGATLTVCSSKTVDLKDHVSRADILVVAVGKAKLIKGDMIKKGAFVVDVGINRLENGKICGDVDIEEAKEIAGSITPVPGGVGPLTVAKLVENLIVATKIQNGVLS